MSHSIKVSADSGFQPPFFVRNFDSIEEFQRVSSLCDNKRRIDWLESLMIPVRTDNLGNFCKDFFLPGLFNEALKTNDLAAKIFLCMLMPIYDILTLPVRLITGIPRYFYNAAHTKEVHPFYQYLIRNGVPAANLSADYVYLEREWIEARGVFGEEGKHNLTSQGETFNFIQLSKTVSRVRRHFGKHDLPNQQHPAVELVE